MIDIETSVNRLRERYGIHIANLRHLEVIQSQYGFDVPLHILNDIRIQRNAIQELEKKARSHAAQIWFCSRSAMYNGDQERVKRLIDILKILPLDSTCKEKLVIYLKRRNKRWMK